MRKEAPPAPAELPSDLATDPLSRMWPCQALPAPHLCRLHRTRSWGHGACSLVPSVAATSSSTQGECPYNAPLRESEVASIPPTHAVNRLPIRTFSIRGEPRHRQSELRQFWPVRRRTARKSHELLADPILFQYFCYRFPVLKSRMQCVVLLQKLCNRNTGLFNETSHGQSHGAEHCRTRG